MGHRGRTELEGARFAGTPEVASIPRVTWQYLRLFQWHVLRYIARHRLLALLNVLSVALGVAVYLAIQVANQSANRAFRATIDVVAGKAELQITAGAGGLPDAIFPAVAQHVGVTAATPLVRGVVTLPDSPGEYLQILGLDIFTNESFRTFELTDLAKAGQFDLQGWLREPDMIAVTEEFAGGVVAAPWSEFLHLQSGVVSASSSVLPRTMAEEPRKWRRGRFMD